MSLTSDRLDTAAAHRTGTDWKTCLQEALAAAGRPGPDYRVTGTGPDHARHYTAEVLVGDDVLGVGTGPSKKQAEQSAAEQACALLGAT